MVDRLMDSEEGWTAREAVRVAHIVALSVLESNELSQKLGVTVVVDFCNYSEGKDPAADKVEMSRCD